MNNRGIGCSGAEKVTAKVHTGPFGVAASTEVSLEETAQTRPLRASAATAVSYREALVGLPTGVGLSETTIAEAPNISGSAEEAALESLLREKQVLGLEPEDVYVDDDDLVRGAIHATDLMTSNPLRRGKLSERVRVARKSSLKKRLNAAKARIDAERMVAESGNTLRDTPLEMAGPMVEIPLSVVQTASALAETDPRVAIDTVLLAVSQQVWEETDVPVRDGVWAKEHHCSEAAHGESCGVFSLLDWKYSDVGNGRCSPNFRTNCVAFVEAALFALNITRGVLGSAAPMKLKRELKESLRQVKGSPYIVYVMRMPDHRFGPLDEDPAFFSQLYAVRQRLGENGDHGYREALATIAEVGDAEAERWYSGISKKMASIVGTATTNLSDLVTKVINAIFSMFDTVVSFVTDALKQLTMRIKKLIARLIIRCVDPKTFVAAARDEGMNHKVALCAVLMVVAFCGFAGFLGYKAAEKILQLISMGRDKLVGYWAESTMDVTALLSGVGIYVFGLRDEARKDYTSTIKMMMLSMAGGTIASNSLGLVFSMLPSTLRLAFVQAYGSEKAKTEYKFETWKNTSLALVSLSRTSSVVCSKYYEETVERMMREGMVLLRACSTGGFTEIRQQVTTVYFKLFTVHSVIVQKKHSNGTRKLPFAMHVAGKPGVGKTLLIGRILREAFGAQTADIYFKSNSDEYWSGYQGQKYVVMDEFLIGDQAAKTEAAKDYLSLVSTAPYMPNMASVDSPHVGIKGTMATPLVVVTMNNTRWDRPPEVPEVAFQRRRQLVLNVHKSLDFRSVPGSKDNFDSSAYTEEELRAARWARFRFLPGQFDLSQDGEDTGTFCTYNVVVEGLRRRFEQHNRQCEIIESTLGSTLTDSRTPEEVINEVLRAGFDMPTPPKTPAEAVFDLFSEFAGEGRKPGHAHSCCGRDPIHWQHGGWSCERCGKSQDCPSEDEELEPRDYLTTGANPRKGDSCPSGVHRHYCTIPKCQRHVACTGNSARPWLCNEHMDSARDPSQTEQAYRQVMMEVGAETPEDGRPFFDAMMNSPEIVQSFPEYREACYDAFVNNADEHFLRMMGIDFDHAVGSSVECFRTGVYTFLLIKAATMVRSWLSGEPEQEYSFNAEVSPTPEKQSRRQRRERPRNWRTGAQFHGQQASHREVPLGVLTFMGKSRVFKTVNVIPILGNWVLTYHHWLGGFGFDLEDIRSATFSFNGNVYDVELEGKDIKTKPEDDLMLIRLRCKTLPQFKDIRRRFISEADLLEMDSVPMRLEESSGKIRFSTAKRTEDRSYTFEGVEQNLSEALIYPVLTEPGDCGLPVVITSGPFANYICGMHVAGSAIKFRDPKGLATIIYRELLFDALNEDIEVIANECVAAWPEMMDESDLRKRIAMAVATCRKQNGAEVSKQLQELLLEKMHIQGNPLFEAEGANVFATVSGMDLPNLTEIERVPNNQQVFMSQKSKLRPSALAGLLPVAARKEPAILHEADPRANGVDPVANAVVRTLRPVPVKVDAQEILVIRAACFNNLNRNLRFPFGRRLLTFEEACAGVPGKLSSLRIDSSAGYPLLYTARRKGKRDFVWFDEVGKLQYSPQFRELVELEVDAMNAYGGEEIDHRFIGYLKDELVKPKKVVAVNTRMTYANSLISLVSLRMNFGAILAAFNNPLSRVSATIGANVQSHDMQVLYDYLREVGKNMYDGDYGEFDIRHQKPFQDAAYGILADLARTVGVTENAINFMIAHETQAPMQIADAKFKTVANNCSGGFWTTIVNCIVNELYFRWCFLQEHPSLVFDEHVRLCLLGDDNVSCFSSEGAIEPRRIRELMAEIGQDFTAANKEDEVGSSFKEFGDISFLGCTPRKVDGLWSGALRKETLWESVQWTRDHNITLDQTVRQMVESASQWDKPFFEFYTKALEKAYREADRQWLEIPSHEELQRAVARRNVMKEDVFVGEGATDLAEGGRDKVTGLTSITTDDLVPTAQYDSSNQTPLASHAINEEAMHLDYGLKSLMRRDTIAWSSTDSAGASLWSKKVPWDILALGNQNNIQNMPFSNYVYFTSDVELVFQINGTPMQAGALIVYFRPLATDTPRYENRPSLNSIFIAPNENTTRTLRIPFRFWRSAMNTFAGALGQESLGTVSVAVQSPLTSNGATSANVTVYSRFIAKFTIPRPIAVSALEESEVFVGEGNTTSVSNSYSYDHCVGDIPTQTTSSTTNSVSASGSMGGLPLDNPPLSGGSVPLHGAFSSMSKSNGVEPTVSMQFHQAMLNREQLATLDNDETKVEHLLNRRCFLRGFSWTSSDAIGVQKAVIEMNSLLLPYASTLGQNIPINVAILNQFQFWRADIVFEIYAVRTAFHSGRLLATVAYGAPSVGASDLNVYLNQVLEFNGENNWAAVKVNYNSATEFLRVQDGPAVPNPVQDYSLGDLVISVTNPLIVSSPVVASSVDVQVFVRFENVRVYETKTLPLARISSFWQTPSLGLTSEFVGEAGPGVPIQEDHVAGDTDSPVIVSTTASESNVMPSRMCKLEIGRKFEYVITDIHELYRRHVKVDVNLFTKQTMTLGSVSYDVYTIPVAPANVLTRVFKAWSGHLKFRIFNTFGGGLSGLTSMLVDYAPTGSYHPGQQNYAFLMADRGKVTSTWSGTTIITGAQRIATTVPAEMGYPVSSNVNMIDVSIPFNSHLNFLPTAYDADTFGASGSVTGYNFLNGYLIVRVAAGSNLEVFQALGDDFRYQIYYPPDQAYVGAYTGTVAPTGADLAGNYF